MSFRLVPKSVTLNDLQRRNGVILRYFREFGYLPGALRKSSRSLSHLLMSSCFYSAPQCSHCKRCTSYSNSVCLSVCLSARPSVTRSYCVKTTARSMVQFAVYCRIAKCVKFCRNQKIFPRDDPFPLKSWLELTYPLLIAASLDTLWPCSASTVRHRTRRQASADRTARRQFQATGQPVTRTQAGEAMTSRLPRYEAKCVQRNCFQCGSVALRSDIKGTEQPPANILIPLGSQLIALQLYR